MATRWTRYARQVKVMYRGFVTDVRRQGSGGKSAWRCTAALEIKMKKAYGSLRVVKGVLG